MSFTWREADADGNPLPNPNGVLDAGEHALIFMDSISFTNQGGVAHFSPSFGTFSSGTIVGFGTGFLDINGTGGTTGTFNLSTPLANAAGTSGFGVRSVWRLAGNGTVNPASDGIINLQFGQFPADPSAAMTENPIPNMFRMLWTPSTFSARTARFQLSQSVIAEANVCGLYLDLDPATGIEVYVRPFHISLGSVSIPIAPAPSTTLALAAAALLAPRRRRPTSESAHGSP